MNLHDQLQIKANEGGSFVSINAVQEIMTRERVRQYFDSGKDQSMWIEAFIPAGRKLLAVLIYSGLEKYIGRFRDRNYGDEIFPVHNDRLIPIENPADLHKFCKSQWRIAPFWNTTVHLDPGEGDAFDFETLFLKSQNPVERDASSFGVVDQVKIREGHVKGYAVDQLFARKTMRIDLNRSETTEEMLMREINTLIRRRHQYIVPFVLSYTKYPLGSSTDKALVVIFPWYKPLSFFMKQESCPDWGPLHDSASRRTCLYEYVYQILQGISYLHRPQEDEELTSHHDLKPANILLDEGKAMIADLGKARLRPASEGSGATDTRLLGTAEYAPPENFDEKGGYAEKRHGRAFDMWAIGCIMIEVAILICYGWEGNLVKTFRTERESLALNLRPFQGHIRNSEQTSRKLESAFYNSIPVIYAWLAKLQSFRHENASEAWKLRKYLRIAVHMLRGNPDARMFSWEAVLDFFDLLHPNASDHERLLKAKEFIQGPNKPGLIDTPIHRAVKRGDLIRVVCLASAEWSADLKNGDEKTPIEIAQEQGHIEIESYLKYVLQRKRLRASDLLPFALIHEVETDCHGFRENTTTSLVPPPPEIWRTSGEEALPHEPLDIPLPAQEYLSRFLENTESTVLYFWNFSATDWADWLIGAIYNLAYGMKDKGHHVIFQEIIEGDDHTKLVVDFTKALLKCFPPLLMEDEDSFVAVDHLRQIVLEHSKLRKPTLPILLVITIATHEEFSGHISSEFLDLIIEHSAPDNGLFKTFFMSESWIDDIGNTLKKYGQDGQQYDVSDWSSIPLRFWCRWEH